MRIAIVEDEPVQAELLQAWLQAEGNTCHVFHDGASLLQAIKRDSFDLLIADWELPDLSGIEVVSRIRQELDWPIPILMATNRDSEQDIVSGLKAGADDYMIKPIRQQELLARMSALLRRSSQTDAVEDILEAPPYRLKRSDLSVNFCGETVQLKTKEFMLAVFLFKNTGRLLSRGHILESVWGQRADLNTRTIDQHISRVRQKLNLNPENGWRLSTVYGHGYRLEQISPDKPNKDELSKDEST